MGIEWTGNLVEGIFWSGVGLCFAISMLAPPVRWDKAVAAATFILFGLSDFVEMHTGAWWRPWWLLAWKATCVAVMGALLWRYTVRRQRRMKPHGPEGTPIRRRPEGLKGKPIRGRPEGLKGTPIRGRPEGLKGTPIRGRPEGPKDDQPGA